MLPISPTQRWTPASEVRCSRPSARRQVATKLSPCKLTPLQLLRYDPCGRPCAADGSAQHSAARSSPPSNPIPVFIALPLTNPDQRLNNVDNGVFLPATRAFSQMDGRDAAACAEDRGRTRRHDGSQTLPFGQGREPSADQRGWGGEVPLNGSGRGLPDCGLRAADPRVGSVRAGSTRDPSERGCSPTRGADRRNVRASPSRNPARRDARSAARAWFGWNSPAPIAPGPATLRTCRQGADRLRPRLPSSSTFPPI